MKNISVEQVLLFASFLGIAYSPFYVFVFVVMIAKSVLLAMHAKRVEADNEAKFKKELEKVQAVSAQIEELQNSINNVRAAVSLGSRR